MSLRWAMPLAIALSLIAMPGTWASHPQSFPDGMSVTFREKTGGNEWWVEVVVGSSRGVSKVEVMDDGGPWASMTYRHEWGTWALSYHVEPGHRVTFRATTSSGVMTSCPFTHPGAVEQCPTSPPPPPPPPPGTFDATFTGVRGNEWWVQANVATNGPSIAKVEATIDGGATWKTLAKQSWGATAWAASFRIVQGSIVQMRATASDGQTDLSSCRQWIPPSNQDATIVACSGSPPPPPPPPAGFTAEFRNVRGNPWWMETDVTATKTIAKVEFREDGGAWVTLTRQSYGSYALSLDFRHQPRVEFRATATTGETDVSYLGYDWAEKPYAVPPTCSHCFDAVRIEQFAGTTREIKVNTFSVARLLAVFATVNDGPRIPMAKDANGDWKATLAQPMPPSSFVRIIAEFRYPGSTTLQTEVMDAGIWPPWPQDGGFVEYAVKYVVPDGGGSFRQWEGTQRWTFHADTAHSHNEGSWRGSWTGRCDLVKTTHDASTGLTTTEPVTGESSFQNAAPFGPRFPTTGSRVSVYIGFTIECVSLENAHLIVQGRDDYTTLVNGQVYTSDAWHGTTDHSWYANGEAYNVHWQHGTGIVLDWQTRLPRSEGPVTNEGSIVRSNVYGVT